MHLTHFIDDPFLLHSATLNVVANVDANDADPAHRDAYARMRRPRQPLFDDGISFASGFHEIFHPRQQMLDSVFLLGNFLFQQLVFLDKIFRRSGARSTGVVTRIGNDFDSYGIGWVYRL